MCKRPKKLWGKKTPKSERSLLQQGSHPSSPAFGRYSEAIRKEESFIVKKRRGVGFRYVLISGCWHRAEVGLPM